MEPNAVVMALAHKSTIAMYARKGSFRDISKGESRYVILSLEHMAIL